MTHAEFRSWQLYYEEAPFDDHHRYHRPAILVSSSMSGGDLQKKMDFLIPPKRDSHSDYSEADLKTLETFGVKFSGV